MIAILAGMPMLLCLTGQPRQQRRQLVLVPALAADEVEGDAEAILLPTIAKIINRPLAKYGVSIVNVGSTAFLRYSKSTVTWLFWSLPTAD